MCANKIKNGIRQYFDMHINTINYSTGTRMNIRAVFLDYTENSIRARCPSTFSSIAIELNLKMTDRYTCNTDIQPNVYGSYLSLLRFSSIAKSGRTTRP